MAPGLPRRLAQVLPTTYSPYVLDMAKALLKARHLGSPYHTFVHCKGFAPAAPRGARASISVPFSGLPLSRPLPIIGLVSLYLTNYLIGRRLILRHKFEEKHIPVEFPYRGLASVSWGYPRPKGRLSTCYWAVCQCLSTLWLAWLNRIPIAATSRRINGI